MLTPFITAPYISRVLGAAGVGIYSYTYSIEMYFSMFAALGTVSYGTREIARTRNDRYGRSRLFWEIELLTVATTCVCLGGWGIWILLNSEYRIYYLILTFYLLATMFDISWLFAGLEEFKYTVMQNAFFKILSVIALFILVKSKDDLEIYIAIVSLSTLLGNLSMWIYLPKFIDRVEIKSLHIWSHFRETLIYFIPAVATSIYTVLDKTLIGAITKDTNENGYYEQATKIINMAKTLTFTSLNSVLGARISFLYEERKFDEIRKRILQSMDYIFFMGLGICFGLLGVSGRFVPIFFGDGYDEVIFLLKMLSPLVIIIGISNCLGSQYYTPAGLRSKSAKYIIIGAVVNLILNLYLIPRYKSNGAVIATIIAELVITILYMRKCNRMLTYGTLVQYGWKKLIAGGIMLSVITIIDRVFESDFLTLLLQLIVGGGIYVLTLLLMRDTFVHGMLERLSLKKGKHK